MGWLLDKKCTLQSKFGYTEFYVLEELDGAKGWAEFHWALLNESNLFGGGLKIVGKGYVAQERDRLIELKKREPRNS